MMNQQYIFFALVLSVLTGCLQQNREKSNIIDLPSLGTLKHQNSKNIGGSYWGIQAGSLSDSILQKASELGVKWTRLHAKWEDIEQAKGVYHWEETDEAFDAVLKYGITPFVTLGNGNRLYSGTGSFDDPKLADIYGDSPAPPLGSKAEMSAWLNFVTAVIERYKNKITYWEIWNEPNHRKFWGAIPNGADYGKLVRATARRIREIQPNAKIIAGSLAGLASNYADAFLSTCEPDNLDIISFHHYAALPEDRIYSFEEFYAVLQQHQPGIEIWQGECGYPSHSRTTGFRGRAPWGLNIQAKWLLRQSFVDSYFCHATLSNYFILSHDGALNPDKRGFELSGMDTILGFPERNGGRVHSNGVNQKCILFRKNAKPKPAFHAYQNLCSAMDDSYKRFKTNYEFEVAYQGVFYGIGEHEDAFPSVPLLASYRTIEGQILLAYWLPWNPQENIGELASVHLQVTNIQLDNPVLLDPLSGKVFDIPRMEKKKNHHILFKDLPLADYPFIILEENSIKLL